MVSKDGSLLLRVKVIPNAGYNRIVGLKERELQVRIQVPAQDGRANRELQRVLAKALDVSKSSVQIVSGVKSRHKLLRLPAEAGPALRSLVAAPRS